MPLKKALFIALQPIDLLPSLVGGRLEGGELRRRAREDSQKEKGKKKEEKQEEN